MLELYHIVNALIPSAEAFTGAVQTVPINLKNFEHVSFVIQCGAGAVGTAAVTVEACSDTTPTTTVAIPFVYQECVLGDTFGAIQKAPVAGFTTAAAANKVYKIDVDADVLAASGYGYIRVKSVESAVGAISGGILAILVEPRYEQEIFDSAIV
jgi:hypothetical protein